MGISVTEDTTTIEVSGDTTVTVTESVTSVSVSDSTATLTVQPSETTVAVTGNTTSINVEAETQEILVNESSYLGNFGGQTLNGSLYVTGHLTHGGVLTDTSSIKHTDFTSEGFMRTDGSGNYTVDSNTYLTSFTELNNLSTSVTWADVPDANITQTSVTQHQAALSITESQISDLGAYLTSFDITTQTDPKYLRADADDTTTGTITADGGFATITGNITSSYGNITIGGSIYAPNINIYRSGSVTTNIATGTGGSGDTKTVNIATGYGTGGTTTVNIAPTSSTTAKQINLNGDVSIGGAVISEIDATVASPSQNTPVLKLKKGSQGSNGTGRFITLNAAASFGADVFRGIIGLSNTTAPQYTNPYMSHTSGSNGIACSYSSSSSFNAITPCASTGLTSNGSLNLGHAYAKWNTVYASSGSINTSDITKKQDIEELSETECRVAVAAKGLLRKYRWKEAVAEKGDNARIHFGIMAQDLKAAFEAEGLDANQYGMFCADTRWTTDGTDTYATEEEALEAVAEEETPQAITEETVYGVRYEELLAFIIAAI